MALDISSLHGNKMDGGVPPDIVEELKAVRKRLENNDLMDYRYTDVDLWKNYTDDRLYELDRLLIKFFASTRWWRGQKKGMGEFKTAAHLVFAWIFNREPRDCDSAIMRTLHKLLTFYCTRKTGQTLIGGKRVPHVYYFSRASMQKKRLPCSLRLRMEEYDGKFSPARPGSEVRTQLGRNYKNVIPAEAGGCGEDVRGLDPLCNGESGQTDGG
jgi:hypothetical protein